MTDRQTRPNRIKDITGNRYGMLVVLGISPIRSNSGRVLFDCQCDCGTRKAIMGTNLKRGFSQSCGCQVIVAAHKPKPQMQTHGMSGTYIHQIWYKMIDRCYNPDDVSYPRYGGRGIRVCDRWKNSIADFYSDMGDRPTDEHTIDRKDNDGDYCPENCRWATAKEQASNRRSSRFLECRGERKTITEWARVVGMGHSSLYHRLEKGMSVEDALFSPKKR